MNKFLVIQTASIGDVILASSIIEKLNQYYPDAEIDFLLKKGVEELFFGHPYIHQLLLWDKEKEKYKNLRKLIRLIRKNHYDCVINVQRFSSTGIITVLSGAKMKIGFSKNPLSLLFSKRVKHAIGQSNLHETARNHALIKALTDNEPGQVRLYPTARDFAATSQYKTRAFITVAPASLWYTKQYPESKWVEFIAEIDPSLYIYFLGSGKDRIMCESIIAASKHQHCLNLAGKLSLLETAALMKDARMNFVNDSAPLHLASAMNARVTAIFCSTTPEFGFGPLSDDSEVVQTKKELQCKPCGLHGWDACPEKHFECALTIDKKQLLKRS
jgi:heptosyltransferase-2